MKLHIEARSREAWRAAVWYYGGCHLAGRSWTASQCGQRAGVPVHGQWRGVMGVEAHLQRLCAGCSGCVWPITGSCTHRKIWDTRPNEGSGLGSESLRCFSRPLQWPSHCHCRRNVPPVPTTATSSHIGACSDLTRYRRSSKVTFLILPFPDLFLVSPFHCRPRWRWRPSRLHGDL